MNYILLGLSGLAGLFYGLWQRSRVQFLQHELANAQQAAQAATTLRSLERTRYESIISDLKSNITKLEEASLANASPDELRARLGELMRPHEG